MTLPHIDGAIRDGRHHMQVRVYYEDTDFPALSYDTAPQDTIMYARRRAKQCRFNLKGKAPPARPGLGERGRLAR